MKTSTKITSIVIIFFLIIATVIIGRTMIGNHFKKKFSKRPPPGIIITTTQERVFENVVSTYGTATPIQTQSFKIEKYEILKPIKFNQKVKKGDVILSLKIEKLLLNLMVLLEKENFQKI
jgi:membrane fusion protein (multidrug efflux system)